MQFHKIKLIYLSIFAAFLLPFAFYTDFFPFLRLGMFAEKPVTQSQQTIYKLWVIDSTKNKHEISNLIGPFKAEQWHYMARNYLLQNKLNFFLAHTHALLPIKSTLILEENKIDSKNNVFQHKTIAIWPTNAK